jgi:hypothetical protein
MRFQRGEGPQCQIWTLNLPPRSLYVMNGPAREEWQHSIPPVKEARSNSLGIFSKQSMECHSDSSRNRVHVSSRLEICADD